MLDDEIEKATRLLFLAKSKYTEPEAHINYKDQALKTIGVLMDVVDDQEVSRDVSISESDLITNDGFPEADVEDNSQECREPAVSNVR